MMLNYIVSYLLFNFRVMLLMVSFLHVTKLFVTHQMLEFVKIDWVTYRLVELTIATSLSV